MTPTTPHATRHQRRLPMFGAGLPPLTLPHALGPLTLPRGRRWPRLFPRRSSHGNGVRRVLSRTDHRVASKTLALHPRLKPRAVPTQKQDRKTVRSVFFSKLHLEQQNIKSGYQHFLFERQKKRTRETPQPHAPHIKPYRYGHCPASYRTRLYCKTVQRTRYARSLKRAR